MYTRHRCSAQRLATPAAATAIRHAEDADDVFFLLLVRVHNIMCLRASIAVSAVFLEFPEDR